MINIIWAESKRGVNSVEKYTFMMSSFIHLWGTANGQLWLKQIRIVMLYHL